MARHHQDRSGHDSPVIVWFREDLRLGDHPALHDAAATGRPVICVWVLDEKTGRAPGGAARWFLAGALESLRDDLAHHDVPLAILSGDAQTLITDLARRCKAGDVFWNDRVEPDQAAQDDRIEKALEQDDIAVHRSMAMLLRRPGVLKTNGGKHYQVFGAYWRAAGSAGDPPDPLPAPRKLQGARLPHLDANIILDPASLRPSHPDWAGGLAETWEPTEDAATERLAHFARHELSDYDGRRDDLAAGGTSRLSADLRHGLISPRQVWQATQSTRARASGFLSELGWREFSYDTLARTPDLASSNLRDRFDHVKWRRAPAELKAWQQGRTGVPIVDAAMRQLWQTGWMHNRARMIVASFLVKHLLIDWRAGEQWFWDTLVDADPANNPVNWQWVAGSGIEATPFFRIFNPVLQAGKFDRSGEYVRTFVPEIAKLPDRALQTPWEQPDDVLSRAGITLDKTYPRPIVDLKGGRERALEAYKNTEPA
ncbi:cryptochrome/photolyase family protein [Tanticharoenia sakaeratensis]|uniref:Deoxyribodipyrimidine photo-lyase n=1 Tax=Tanticharoenia sakaeratensis NBRC 103193 TaxID=1231623 RepID=A0A0D6MMN7_9PROT|nr:deoxyribodipyrimidine photo-lyase [Tanticharoenia sakaeratensis]GAN54548.1 deoxyribodipyrimidine photolyase [Tanticharoenia sakaeratensis NBRC 103193]GBQ24462.1 deoxyribodipyrimidine photolyase [Tanticharoenia sakaeratensis NBRC 103193]